MRRHAPDVYGLPGAASFLRLGRRTSINEALARHYQRNVNPVAFIDESFETDARDTFYVIAVAVVNDSELGNTRQTFREFYGGSAVHASPMFKAAEYESLRQATRLVGTQNDGMDIVVCAPIQGSRDDARSRCLSHAAAKVHADFGVSLFVLDQLGTPTEDRLDQRTFTNLRTPDDGRLHRDTVAIHVRPSDELLLGLPDVLAWAYRQTHTRGDDTWFEPLRDCTEVTVL